MTHTITIPAEVQAVIDAGGLIFAGHSGGKDSQAMFAILSDIVPADQLIAVHADLGRMEWTGVEDHIHATINGHKMATVQAIHADGSEKDFFSMVRNRRQNLDKAGKLDTPAFPSSCTRQCTSDLKTGPIQKFMKAEMKRRNVTTAINAIGIRSEESSARSKKNPLTINKKMNGAGRQVWDWLPIFDLTIDQVKQTITDAGQELHWAYKRNDRLSCVFCIMGNMNDLGHGAECRPELLAELIELEVDVRTTMFNTESLADKIKRIQNRKQSK